MRYNNLNFVILNNNTQNESLKQTKLIIDIGVNHKKDLTKKLIQPKKKKYKIDLTKNENNREIIYIKDGFNEK